MALKGNPKVERSDRLLPGVDVGHHAAQLAGDMVLGHPFARPAIFRYFGVADSIQYRDGDVGDVACIDKCFDAVLTGGQCKSEDLLKLSLSVISVQGLLKIR